MSNENLKRVFEKLLNLKGKNGKPGYILCLASKGNKDATTDELIGNSKDLIILNEAYKKPLWAMGCRKRKKPSNIEIDIEAKQLEMLEKTRERHFASLATKGVVQMFNAITSHQREIDQKLNEAGKSETKKEKVISTTTKSSFIQRLNSKPARKTYTIDASL